MTVSIQPPTKVTKRKASLLKVPEHKQTNKATTTANSTPTTSTINTNKCAQCCAPAKAYWKMDYKCSACKLPVHNKCHKAHEQLCRNSNMLPNGKFRVPITEPNKEEEQTRIDLIFLLKCFLFIFFILLH